MHNTIAMAFLREEEEKRQRGLAHRLTLSEIRAVAAGLPEPYESMEVREAAAAVLGLRILSRGDIYPQSEDGKLLPKPALFDQPAWCRQYARDIKDPEALVLITRFLNLVDAVEGEQVRVGARVPFKKVLDTARIIGLSAQTAQPSPAPVAVVADVASDGDSAVPRWALKSIERSPGYRWPLHQVLKAAHKAGQPCPKARDVLEVWRLNPPADLEVMSDGVKYNNGVGEQKEANLKAIQQAIKNLVK